MSWEIIAALITLVTFGIAICKIVANNTKVITELKCSVDQISCVFREQKERQDCAEETISDHSLHLAHLDEKVERHEKQISALESKN